MDQCSAEGETRTWCNRGRVRECSCSSSAWKQHTRLLSHYIHQPTSIAGWTKTHWANTCKMAVEGSCFRFKCARLCLSREWDAEIFIVRRFEGGRSGGCEVWRCLWSAPCLACSGDGLVCVRCGKVGNHAVRRGVAFQRGQWISSKREIERQIYKYIDRWKHW